jgi:AraC-like DNA-binding protein
VDKRVEKILEMMRDDVRGELSLGQFAQSVNLSVWRLCHIFKSDVGMPPIKYLRLLRMERAKGLLESSFLSVKEIAFQVGLNDESHFVRDFKSTYGFSPAIYRLQFKRNGTVTGTETPTEMVTETPMVTMWTNRIPLRNPRRFASRSRKQRSSRYSLRCTFSFLSFRNSERLRCARTCKKSAEQNPLMNDKKRQAQMLVLRKLKS